MKPERLAETLTRIEALIAPTLRQAGVELVDLVLHRGHKRMTLRLTIDRVGRERYRGSSKEPKPKDGVTISDCARISKLVGPLLETEDVIPGAYTLEVSSPGVNRPLKTPEHFRIATGLTVRVKSRVPLIDTQKFFIAPLVDATDEHIVLDVHGQSLEVPYRHIERANVEFQF